MVAEDLTFTIVGSYATLDLAVAGMDAENDATVDDNHILVIEPGVGANRYKVLKYVRATA